MNSFYIINVVCENKSDNKVLYFKDKHTALEYYSEHKKELEENCNMGIVLAKYKLIDNNLEMFEYQVLYLNESYYKKRRSLN